MATHARSVDVTDDPVRLDSPEDEEFTDKRRSLALAFWNAGPDTVYLGGTGVDTDEGTPVPGESWSPGFTLGSRDLLYAVCAEGETAELRVLEVGV